MLSRSTTIAKAALLALACAVAMPGQSSELHFRLAEEPETLYGVETLSLTASETMGTYITERLVYLDANGRPAPWLAEGWDISEDQKQITFRLRQGVAFHDGTPFNAEAVKSQFDALLDPGSAAPARPMVGPVASIEVVDEHTVRFEFDEPFAPFFNNLSIGLMGINSPSAVAEHGERYGRNVVGTGPYRLTSWIPGTRIELERNDNFIQWREDAKNRDLPHAESVKLTVIRENAVAMAALEAGELTAAVLESDVIDRFVGDPEFNLVINDNTNNLVFLEFNQNSPPFDEPLVRRAIGAAIDRSAVIAAAWSGYATEALSPLARGIPGFDEDVAEEFGVRYDPARAAELLAEAGWTDSDGNGVLDRDGVEARWTITSYSGSTPMDRTLAVIQSNLREIGVEVDLVTSDWGAYYPSLLQGDWDMTLLRWTTSDPNILSRLFRSPGHREHLKPNEELDSLLDRCNTLLDPALRAECVSQAQAALIEADIVFPILSSHVVFVTQGNVEDFNLDFSGNLIPGDIRVAD